MSKDLMNQFFENNGVKLPEAAPKPEGDNLPLPQNENNPSQTTSIDPVEQRVEQPTELSDSDLLALIEKRGLKLPAKTEPTEEERKAAEAKRKSDALAWGLQSGKFKSEDYEELTRAESRKMDLLVEEFAAELKANNPDMDEEALQSMISSYTYSDLEDTDPVKIKRQKELIELGAVRLKSKYKSIYGVDSEYGAHIEEQERIASENRRVEAAIPVYQSDVKSVLAEFKKGEAISIEDSQNPENTVTVNLSYSEEDLREIETHFLNATSAIDCVKKGYSLEDLKNGVEIMLLKKHFKRHISKAAKDYNSVQKEAYLRGEKGITPGRRLNGSSSQEKNQVDAYIQQQLDQAAGKN
jgi:hypothetical protein